MDTFWKPPDLRVVQTIKVYLCVKSMIFIVLTGTPKRTRDYVIINGWFQFGDRKRSFRHLPGRWKRSWWNTHERGHLPGESPQFIGVTKEKRNTGGQGREPISI